MNELISTLSQAYAHSPEMVVVVAMVAVNTVAIGLGLIVRNALAYIEEVVS